MPVKSIAEYKRSASWFKFSNFDIACWRHVAGKDKPTILFIHGFPSASWDWHYQWQALKNDYNLLALDMLGYGLSDKPAPYEYTLVEQAQIYVQWLCDLNIKRCHILAHDYGDSVTQELLHLVSTQQVNFSFDSITFLNGGLFSEVHRPLFTQTLLKSRLGPLLSGLLKRNSLERSFNKIFGEDSQPSEHDIDCLWQLLLHNQGTKAMPYILQYIDERKHRRADWVKAMQSTKIPMYFINGALDPISGEHMRQRFCELLPGVKTASLQVGHYPQIEAPEKMLQLFEMFISEISD